MANSFVADEPVVTAGVVAGIIIFLAAKLGIVIDEGTGESIAAGIIPIILAVIARAKVTPVS